MLNEEIQEKDPAISFDTALKKVYAQFGTFGFSKLVAEKTEAVRQRQRMFSQIESFKTKR